MRSTRDVAKPRGVNASVRPQMIAEYKFRYDEAYVVEALKHYRRQHHSRRWLWFLKLVGYLGLGALVAVGIYAKSIPLTTIFVFFIALLAVGPHLDYWWVRRQLRKSPSFHSEVLVRFTEDHYYGQDANGHGELLWRAFVKGFRFRDGILLFTSPQQFHWLPDSGISVGSASAASSLLLTKVTKYYGAEQNAPEDALKQRASER